MQRSPAEVLGRARRLAVVGASRNPDKAAHYVPAQLQAHGWEIVPVNPSGAQILGRTAGRSLAEVDGPIDLVIVFRPSPEAESVTRQAIAAGAGGVWLQQGIRSEAARALAAKAGIDYVEDSCSAVVRAVYGVRPGYAGGPAAR